MNKVSFERPGRNALAKMLGTLFPVRKRTPDEVRASLQKGEIKKLLIIRPHQGYGDLLLASPILRAIKKTYPGVEIHFLADTYNQIAVRDNPHLKRVWTWDKKAMRSPGSFWSFMRALRAERFDLAIPLFSHVPSFTSFLIAWASGAQTVWSYSTAPFYGGANWSRYLTSVALPNRPETDPEWVKFMELVRPLGADDSYEPEFVVPSREKELARQKWQELNLPESKPKVALFLGGNPDRPERLWPASQWGELAERLQATPSVSLILILPPKALLSGSGALERGMYDEISHRLRSPVAIFDERGLARAAAFLQGTDLFVCTDGGLFHIAAASRVPTLGLFFVTIPERWAPPVPWVQTLHPADDLPASLSAEDVYRKMMEMISGNIGKSIHLCSTK